MQHILVPVDFSQTSAYALEVAATIAKKQKATLSVIHMLGLSEAVLTKDETQEYDEAKYYMELAKKRFKDFLNKPYLKGLKVYEIVQNYKIFSELNNVAKEHKIDLIVMGSHGASGFSGFFVGSNTEKVVRTSDVPVLVIKEQMPDFNLNKILFGCNFDEENILAFKKAKQLAKLFSAAFKPIYINLPSEGFKSTLESEKHISDFLFKAGESDTTVAIYNDYNVERGLFNYSQKNGIDAIAIPTHGRKGLSHFFVGSIGEDVANHATLPVLTIKI